MRVPNFRNQLNRKRARMMFALAFAALGLACLLGYQWRAQARVNSRIGCPTITFTSNMLPIITMGAPTSLMFTATGGFPAYKYAVTAGALPNNMSLAVNGL